MRQPDNDILSTSSPEITQIILSTAHPAKFSEAVTRSLDNLPGFDFDRDILPEEFKGLLKKEKRVINVDSPTVEAVKKVIDDNELGKSTKHTKVGV